MLQNSNLGSFSFINVKWGKKRSNSLLTCSVAVSITRAFGTNSAVLVFLINVTDSTGIKI